MGSTVGGQSALSCQTNTSNFNLTSSSLFFITSYQDGRGNENTSALWEHARALHLASYKLDSNFSSLSCCVLKTSLCPGVCSEEHLNVLNGKEENTIFYIYPLLTVHYTSLLPTASNNLNEKYIQLLHDRNYFIWV